MNDREKCQCTMAISMLGDGCRYCQPQEYIDRLHEGIDEDRAELDKANARIAQLEELIDIAYDHLLGAGYEKGGVTLQKLNLAKSIDTLPLVCDTGPCRLCTILDAVRIMYKKKADVFKMRFPSEGKIFNVELRIVQVES